MKLSRKNLITACLLVFTAAIFAQKQSKNYSETFNIKKDAVVEINASNADVEVQTWRKNQVDVKATIEIDGLTKEEAEKYFKNYQFEAMGNSNKVRILVGGGNSFQFGNEFVIFDPENFVIPEIDIPEIDIPEIVIPEINIPDINIEIPEIDFEKFVIDLDNMEFDFEEYSKNGKNYFFQWKDSVKNIKIKNKKDWEKFKKSKEYKEWQEEMKKNKAKIKKELEKAKKEYQNINVGKLVEESLKIAEEAMKNVEVEKLVEESLKEAREELKKVDRKKIKAELAKVREEFKKAKGNKFVIQTDSDELIINDKKVKIKKKIVIKVPKGVTLDLNTRHCKLKLPKMSASGKVSYGTFNAEGLEGGKLDIFSSPVKIQTVENTTLNLKNVTDAALASVANSELNSDSGDLEVMELLSGNNIVISFGEIKIDKVSPSLSNFEMKLNQSEAEINLAGFSEKLDFSASNVVKFDKSSKSGKGMSLKGNIKLSTRGGQMSITGKYSELLVKQ